MAVDLRVDLPDAGLPGYALSVAFGAPPVAALAARFGRTAPWWR